MKLQQLTILLFCLLVACSDDGDDNNLPYKGNYFPVTPGSHWTYELKRNCEWPDETELCVDTNEARVLNTTLEWDEAYQRVETPVLAQFVKVSGSEYFATGYYIPEYKFLDDALPAGSKWGSEDEFSYNWHEIKAVNISKVINGKSYRNVIVVEAEESYSDDRLITNIYYYAKDIGLIYRKQIITYKDWETQTREFSLKDYFVAR